MRHDALALDADCLRALHRMTAVVTASLDLDTTLGAILDAAQELTGAHLVAILLLESAEQLVIRIGRGDVASALGERVPANQGIVGRALQNRRPVLVPDMLTEIGRARPDLDARSGLRTYLVVPLIWRGDALGAVTVGSTEPDTITATQVALIGELVVHAAAAVAHSRDYGREQARRLEVENLNRTLAEQTAELERTQQQLVQTEKLRAIGQLAHGIAHEINTPLGVVVSNLSVLDQYGQTLANVANLARQTVEQQRDDRSPGLDVDKLAAMLDAADLDYLLQDLPQLIEESSASAQSIATIIRSVATFARRDADRVSPVEVESLLETAITLAWNEIKHRGDVVRDFGAAPRTFGHVSELTQVFVHLLLNAAQALDERRGTITISTRTDTDGVVITIADTGRGIAAEHLARVFDPFFTTRPPGRGTGMGLAVCHGIISRHGGAISLDSTPGQGTQVTVRLPVVHEAIAA